MNFRNKKEARDYEVERWLIEEIPNITPYQKDFIRKDFVRFSRFYFYKRKPKTNGVLRRFSVLLVPFVFLIVLLLLPINYIITGRWGFGRESAFWRKYTKWIESLNLN